jgi:hypothetical protein
MHPYLAQALAAERGADMRRDAAASRQARELKATAGQAGKPGPARRSADRRAPRHAQPVAHRRSSSAGPVANQLGGEAHRPAGDVLVGPAGAGDESESAALCAAGC